MAKQHIVARGEIHRDGKVIACEGGEYKPKNAAERDRLVARGIIVEVEDGRKSGGQAALASGGNETPPAGSGQQGGESGEGGGGAGDQSAGG